MFIVETPLQGKVHPPLSFPLNFAETMCYFDTDFTWKIPSKITLHWAVTNK